ncbi:MAG: DotU family type IV/VI secretion system protein [Rhodospirillaceae bacterium]|nr:DotU family type IV/VI secretion system protein [Rhodospirillaceae bacterium]
MASAPPLLLDIFRPVIDRALALAGQVARAAPSAPPAELNSEVFQALRAVRDEARAAGKSDGPVLAATFAVAAWVDDMLSAHAKWYGQTPRLTQVLFKTDDGVAGTVERLRALPDAETDARSVILLVIGLGLSERRPDQAARLEALHRQETDRLIRALGLHEAGLTPQPGRMADPPRLAPPRAPRRLAVPVGLAGLLVLAAWPVVALVGAEPAQTDVAVLAEVDPLAALIAEAYDCAEVHARLEDGQLVVNGFAQSEADRDGIASAVSGLPDLHPDRVEIDVLPWPFCEVAGNLSTLASPDAGDAPVVALSGGSGILTPGDNLVVDVFLEPRNSGYLYVDLIDPDGRVVHLLPEPARPDNILAGQTAVTIGNVSSTPDVLQRAWTVAEPPGRRMLLALISPVPLFAGLRPPEEPITGYLEDMSGALREIPGLGGGDHFPMSYTIFDVEG